MSAVPRERAPTFEELYRAIEALPEGLTGEILEPGVIRTMSRPGAPHRIGTWTVRRALGDDDVWEGGRGWWLEQEAEIRLLEDRLVVPDLSGWRLDGEDSLPPAFAYDNPIVRLPAWCCEVLSPSTEKTDRELKLPLYAEAGVEWIWLVDPVARRLEIFQTFEASLQRVELVEGDRQQAFPPFTSVVDTRRWWVTTPKR